MDKLSFYRFITFFFFALTFNASISAAEPLSLYCTIEGDSKGEVYKVDLTKRIVILDDVFEFKIVQVDQNYMTAINRTDSPGGWIWTLNSNTGQFAAAVVGFKQIKQQSSTVKELGADSYKGTCTKKLL